MMRKLVGVLIGLFLVVNVFGQNDKVNLLISEGTQLHDQGKYDEAIAKYRAALDIDKNSSEALYELSFTYLSAGRYDDAIDYSKRVIDGKGDSQQGAYMVLGNSLDLTGKPEKAIKAYREGLKKFPQSSLLSYNLALTLLNQKEYDEAEAAAIQAITANPNHASSHLVLSSVMQAKGERVKSIIPLYYFLMLEPKSRRSAPSYAKLLEKLGQGVVQKDAKNVTISIPFSQSKGDRLDAAEVMVSMLAASRYSDENRGKSEMDLFVDATSSFFSILSELKKENRGFWWDFYVTTFEELKKADCCPAFCYTISQSDSTKGSEKWMFENPGKVQEYICWINGR